MTRRRSTLFVPLLLVLLVGTSVSAQEHDTAEQDAATLEVPEAWIAVDGGFAPLRVPPTPPVGPDAGVLAPDGTQVLILDGDEIVLTDVWGGGRRLVYRADRGPGHPDELLEYLTPVAFSGDSSRALFVDLDGQLVALDLATGERDVRAQHPDFVVTLADDGPVTVESIRELATGDVLVESFCRYESCGRQGGKFLVRADTDDVVEIPRAGILLDRDRGLLEVEHNDGDATLFVAPVRDPARRIVLTQVAESVGFPHQEHLRPDGVAFALLREDGRIEVRSIEDGAVLFGSVPPDDSRFVTASWTTDGATLAVTVIWQDPFERQVFLIDGAGSATPVGTREDEFDVIGRTDDGRPLVAGMEGVVRRVGADLSTPAVTTTFPRIGDGEDGVHPRRARVGVVDRYAGVDRVATAVSLSRSAFADAPAVVVARADTYPDGLAGSTLAGLLDAPVLLTNGDGLDPRVRDEVQRLGADTAYVLGSTDVVDEAVVAGLQLAGVARVERLGGDTRFDTAALVAAEVDRLQGGRAIDHAFLVEGSDPDPFRGWPDAVAVAGRAATEGSPVLLTPTESLPDATFHAIRDLGISRVTIVGGPVAVSRRVADQLQVAGVTVDRIDGDDRWATSADVAASAPTDPSLVLLVTGRNWPDALAAGPAAAHLGAGVLLTDRDELQPPTLAYLEDRFDQIVRVAVLGSTTAVGQYVVREVNAIVE